MVDPAAVIRRRSTKRRIIPNQLRTELRDPITRICFTLSLGSRGGMGIKSESEQHPDVINPVIKSANPNAKVIMGGVAQERFVNVEDYDCIEAEGGAFDPHFVDDHCAERHRRFGCGAVWVSGAIGCAVWLCRADWWAWYGDSLGSGGGHSHRA